MKEAWIRGSLWDRAALAWKGTEPESSETLDVFKELRCAQKILILPNDRVGGLFIGAPIYKALRQKYPDAEISLLVDESKESIASQLPFVDTVITTALSRSIWNAEFEQFAAELGGKKFDIAFCLGADCSFRLVQLCKASGARLRVGFRRQGVEPFNIEIVPRSTRIYEGDQYSSMLRMLGIDAGNPVKWTLSQDQAQKIRERYLDDDFAKSMVVGIDIARGEGGGLSNRQVDDVVGRVIERGARALLFFSLAEKKRVNYLKETYGNRALLFEQDNLPDVAALIEGCTVLIACNTDLLHLGISLQVPSVGIFEDDPLRWVSSENPLVKVVQGRDTTGVKIAQIVHALEEVLRVIRDTESVG